MALSKYDIAADLVREPGTSHAFMVELVGSNKRVLDIGCDTGYLGVNLAALGNSVSGVEVDPVTAAEAMKHLDRVVVADLERVNLVDEFGPGTFDVIIFGDVLEHLRDPLPVLRQARPLLTPGGSVVISTPNVAHGDIRMALLQGRFDYTKIGILDETHTRFFTRKSLVQFLSDAGFVLADLRRTHAPLFGTEAGVRVEEIDPVVVAKLQEDPEATTYQFVLRAVPDDATSLQTVQALALDDSALALRTAEGEIAELKREAVDLRARLTATTDELAASSLRESVVQAAHDLAVSERDAGRLELDALRNQVAQAAPTSIARAVVRKLRTR